jgi:Leucine-rich repeat (LRR) protein
MGSQSFCLLILFLFFVPSLSESSDISTLLTLRHSVAEEKGFLHSWFHLEIPPRSWSGITCSGHNVVVIDLPSMPLYAPFPCIGAFVSLVGLNFSGCGFTGELPDALENLQNLQYLYLSNNQLAGLGPCPPLYII